MSSEHIGHRNQERKNEHNPLNLFLGFGEDEKTVTVFINGSDLTVIDRSKALDVYTTLSENQRQRLEQLIENLQESYDFKLLPEDYSPTDNNLCTLGELTSHNFVTFFLLDNNETPPELEKLATSMIGIAKEVIDAETGAY